MSRMKQEHQPYAFRRHLPSCQFFGPGGREARADKCSCPFHADGVHNGRRIKRHSLKTRNRQIADRKIADLVRKLDAEALQHGTSVAPERPKIADAVDRFLRTHGEIDQQGKYRGNSERGTWRKYRGCLERLSSFCTKRHVDELARIDEDFLEDFRATRDIELRTWKGERQMLITFLGYCVRRKWIQTNPAKGLKAPKVKPNEVVPYTLREEAQILAACDQIGGGKCNRAGAQYEQLRAKAMILLLRHTALRISDVCTLRRDAISRDSERGTWRVFVRTQKTGEPVFLPIPDTLKVVLDALPLPRNAAQDCPYFFWNGVTSRRAVVGIAERTLASVFKKSGVKKAHAHRYRHTLATRMLAYRSLAAKPHAISALVIVGMAGVAVGALSCLAAQAFRRQSRFARPLIAMNSILNLPYVPFGTVAGAVGLYWCVSAKARSAEPLIEHFEHQPAAGDGTSKWIQQAAPIVSLAVWFAALYGVGWWGRTHGLPHNALLNGVPLLLVCEWITVVLHELGHVFAGWASDMSLVSFAAGPVHAEKKAGQWTFKFNLAGILSAGGAVGTVPLHLKRMRPRMAFEAAGGPAASFVTSAVAFMLLLTMPGSPHASWWPAPALIAAISAATTVLNLIPFRFAAGFSDGAALVQLIRGGPFADLREALKLVGTTTSSPTRPRDLDPRLLAKGVRAGAGTPEEGMLELIQMVCAVDRHDLEQARRHLDASLQRIPAPGKAPTPGIAAEMAIYIAYLDGDASRAAEWLQGAEKLAEEKKHPLRRDPDYWRAVVAVREAQGEERQSEDAYWHARLLLDEKPDTGSNRFEREFLQVLRSGEWVRGDDNALSEASF